MISTVQLSGNKSIIHLTLHAQAQPIPIQSIEIKI